MLGFFMAWGMFLNIPCPIRKWDESKYGQMLISLPIVGLLIGAIIYIFAKLPLGRIIPYLWAAILCFISLYITGFIHLDGYMDCADAYLSRRDREERIKILKDPHVGAFAVIALGIYLILLFATYIEVNSALNYDLIHNNNMALLIIIPVVSRISAVFSLFSYKPMHGSSYSKMLNDELIIKKQSFYKLILMIYLFTCIMTTYVIQNTLLIVILVEIMVSWIVITILVKSFGGMSGDISGCSITMSELAGLITLAIILKI